MCCWDNQMAVAAALADNRHTRKVESLVRQMRSESRAGPTQADDDHARIDIILLHLRRSICRASPAPPASPPCLPHLRSTSCCIHPARAVVPEPEPVVIVRPRPPANRPIHPPKSLGAHSLALKAYKIQQHCQLISLAFSSHGARATCKLHTHTQQMPVKRPVSRRETSANTSNVAKPASHITYHASCPPACATEASIALLAIIRACICPLLTAGSAPLPHRL
jgi:hypothetical protein